jgi:CHRD domain
MITTGHRAAALTLAAAAALTFAGAGAAQAAPAIPLTTGQESPAPTDGGAHGFFTYEIGEGELCYTLEVTGLTTPAVAAHIHVAPRNVPGPIVIPLVVENETSFEVDTCVPADQAVLDAIAEDPSAYYVNVHTTMNMPGEVRGQLK